MININFIDDDYTDNRAEQVNEWVDEIGHEFQKSAYFKNLLPVEQECGFFLLDVFFDYSYRYCLVGPGKLNEETMNKMMLDVMPRKISAERSTFEAFSSVMENFLCWCEENHHLINTKNLREHIHKTAPEMISRSQNSKYWDAAKSFMMSGFSKVNSNDAENKKIGGNGYGVKSKTRRRGHEKIGRNDACSCGSGKKYKKCCLLAANS